MLCACFNALCLFRCSVLVYLLGESMTCVLSPPTASPPAASPPATSPKPLKTLLKSQQPQKKKRARAVTRTTPEICQAPVPSRPGTKYPVRGNPSLRPMRFSSNKYNDLRKNTEILIKQQQSARPYANNARNLPGPGPIAPRDEISRSGEPLTQIQNKNFMNQANPT